jgi:archaetidylinositol phosphate synthase
MILSRGEYLSRWSTLHGEVEPSALVRGWLTVAYVLARPFAALRFSPDVVTLFGLITAALALWLADAGAVVLAAVIVIFSLIFDGLDGAVAVLRSKESRWGAVLDAAVDRISEALWAIALVVVGVPPSIALAAWVVASVQEYARARVASLGHHQITLVSICERPVRAIFIAVALAASIDAAPDALGPTTWATVWLAFQTVALIQVVRDSHRSLG